MDSRLVEIIDATRDLATTARGASVLLSALAQHDDMGNSTRDAIALVASTLEERSCALLDSLNEYED